MLNHRIRIKINDEYTRTIAKHVKNKDLTNYETDGVYIFKYLTDEEYTKNLKLGLSLSLMSEIGLSGEYDYSYKPTYEK